MQGARVFAIVAVLAAVALAGCTTEAPATEGLDPAGSGAPGLHAATGTAANGTGLDLPGAPVDAWLLEAWGDAREVVLLDATGEVRNDLTTAVLGCPLMCNNAFLQPADGNIVLPGTREVHLLVEYEPPATAPTMVMNLAYRTAAEDSITLTTIGPGETLVVPADPLDWDAPFQAASHWWFSLFPVSRGVDAIPPMEVRVVATLVRAADLPRYDAPRDPWGSGASIPLQQGATRTYQGWRGATFNSCFECNGFWESNGPGLVAPGASRVEATLAWDWLGPTKPMLYYWNGVQGGAPMALGEDGTNQRTFTVDVPADQADSPYQTRSLWGFFIQYDTNGQDVGLISGSMTLDAVAVRGA